jgi:hypothetical protein
VKEIVIDKKTGRKIERKKEMKRKQVKRKKGSCCDHCSFFLMLVEHGTSV